MIAGVVLPHPEPGAVLELFRWCPLPPPRPRLPPLYLARLPRKGWIAAPAGGHITLTWPGWPPPELPARRVRVQLALPMVRR